MVIFDNAEKFHKQIQLALQKRYRKREKYKFQIGLSYVETFWKMFVHQFCTLDSMTNKNYRASLWNILLELWLFSFQKHIYHFPFFNIYVNRISYIIIGFTCLFFSKWDCFLLWKQSQLLLFCWMWTRRRWHNYVFWGHTWCVWALLKCCFLPHNTSAYFCILTLLERCIPILKA